MDFDPIDIVKVFDRVGIVAFALSGVEVGMRRRLDLFGLLVMGVVTATGGGAIRDVLLGRLPFVLDHWDYLVFAGAATAIAIALAWRHRTVDRRLLNVADAVGLGAFAVAGAIAGIEAGVPLPAVIVLAVITGTGGGVIRDLLADRVPLVLRAEVNATSAVLGGFTVWAIEPIGIEAAALAGLTVTALVRVLTLMLNLNLPSPGATEGKQRRLL